MYCRGVGHLKAIDCIDLQAIESMEKSPLGEDYTLLTMSGGENITVNMSMEKVTAKLVHMQNQAQIGEVIDG